MIHSATACARQVEALETENAELRTLTGEMSRLLAGGVRTANTDMIMGALLSGGDVMALAKALAKAGDGPMAVSDGGL